MRRFGAAVGTLVFGLVVSTAGADDSSFLGRWDLTVKGPGGAFPSWLEIRKSGHGTLVGSYVGQFGSARPVSHVVEAKGVAKFAVPPQWERRRGVQQFELKLEGDELKGSTTDERGKPLTLVGRRAPLMRPTKPAVWGEPVDVFNGKDLAGFEPRSKSTKNGWKVVDGVLTNASPGNDLVTTEKYGDFKLHAEFRYPKGSNSGIYLRGRYEVQIEDNFGLEPDSHYIGGVYGFLTPCVNAAKPAGEWQSMDVELQGRAVTIVFNGERVIDRQMIPGITGGALDSDEASPGPLMIQGDHGVVEFRKLTLTPAK